MDINAASLFTRLIELSPFVAALFFFLTIVWKSLQKKDEAMMTIMKDNATSNLQMQKESIMAQNNSADAHRALSDSIDKMREHLVEGNTELLAEIRGVKRNNGRPVKVALSTPAQA